MNTGGEEAAIQFLSRILNGDMSPPRGNEFPEDGDSELVLAAKKLGAYAVEAYDYMSKLSSGDLSTKAPQHNLLLGSSKELQSVLRHLLWTVECIANGDFQQSVDFLGDFSKYFNLFTKQVELREKEQKENARLEKENLERKNLWLKGLLQQQLEHYKSLNSMHKIVRGMKHDMKNHCFTLNELLNWGEIQAAQEYLSHMSSQLLVAQDQIYNTGNPVFDALLTDKISTAKNMGIAMDVQLAMGEDLKVSNLDWCVILGNTLDNAIEACSRLEEEHKQIWIGTQVRRDILNLTIKNTAHRPVPSEKGLYTTSKTDCGEHGIGLGNVQAAVERYHGVMQTKWEDGYFSILIMLCGV